MCKSVTTKVHKVSTEYVTDSRKRKQQEDKLSLG